MSSKGIREKFKVTSKRYKNKTEDAERNSEKSKGLKLRTLYQC